jgi:hypothetical protein
MALLKAMEVFEGEEGGRRSNDIGFGKMRRCL